MASMSSVEVLVARIAPCLQTLSSAARYFFFSSRSSNTALDDQIGIASASTDSAGWISAMRRSASSALMRLFWRAS